MALYKERLEQVVALDPGHLRAKVGLARLMVQAGNLSAAGDQATEMLRIAPDDSRALDLSGVIALLQGRLEDAAALLQRAYARDPTTTAVLKLAYAQQRAGDGAGSRRTLLRRLEEVPADAGARLVLANKFLSMGELEDAQVHYAKIVLLAPNNVVALNNLAWVSLQLGQTETALGYVERAHQLAPDDPRIADTFGLAQLRAGDAHVAVSTLRRAHSRAPESLKIQLHLAQALAKQGETAEAREVLRRILSGNAGFPEQTDAEALLRELGG
jgi:Flp pilus assembly protein TadD